MLISKELLQTYKDLTNKSICGINEQLSEFQKTNDKAYQLIGNVIEDGEMLEDEAFLKCYDHFLSTMSNVNEALRKLSLQLHYNDIEKHDPDNIFRHLNCIFQVHKSAKGLGEAQNLKNASSKSISGSGSFLKPENLECNAASLSLVSSVQSKVSSPLPEKIEDEKDSNNIPIPPKQEEIQISQENDSGADTQISNDLNEEPNLTSKSSSEDTTIHPVTETEAHCEIPTPKRSESISSKEDQPHDAIMSIEDKPTTELPKKEDKVPDEKVIQEETTSETGTLPAAPQEKDCESEIPKKENHKKAGRKKKKSSITKKISVEGQSSDKSLITDSSKKTSPSSQSTDTKKETKISKNATITTPIIKAKPAHEKQVDNEPADEEQVDEGPAYDEQVDKEPAYDEPLDEEPAHEKPANEEQLDNEPADEEQLDNEPADEEQLDNEPADEEQLDNEPADNEPAAEEQVYNDPANDEPADEELLDNEPADEEQVDDELTDDGPAVQEEEIELIVPGSNQTIVDEATVKVQDDIKQRPQQRKNCPSNFYTKLQEEFIFPAKCLTKKLDGAFLKSCVTCIHNASELEFFLLDINDPDNSKLTNMTTISLIDIPIDPSEVFAVFDHGSLVRVVISKYQNQAAKFLKVLLIDFGDVIQISRDTLKFRLSKEYQELEAQALPAKCTTMQHLPDKGRSTLESIVNVPAKFFVFSIKNNVMDVHFFQTMDGDYNSSGVDLQDRFPFSDFKPKKVTANGHVHKKDQNKENILLERKQKEKVKKSSTLLTKPVNKSKKVETQFIEKDDIPSTSSLDKAKKKSKCSNSKPKSNSSLTNPFLNPVVNSNESSNNFNNLTQEALKELWQEPINAQNPMMALLGHCPKDEERICKHYNPKTGDCFKRGFCKKEHTLLEPNGWTKDQKVNNSVSLHLTRTFEFVKNDIYKIRVTYVLEPTKFYAHIVDDDGYNDRKFVWNFFSIPQSTILKKPPQPFQMVLALHNDNQWYRAQVEFSVSATLYSVYFIDYGNRCRLPISLLARYDESTSLFPPQAHLFHIGGVLDVCLNQEQNKKCKKLVSEKLFNQEFNIKILRVCNGDVFVGFYGEYANFIKQLVKQGYLEKQRRALENNSME